MLFRSPYSGYGENAFISGGPDVRLSPSLALAFAMALQELMTNAVKYGALSTPAGQVAIRWTLEPGATRRLRLRWQETGGPPVQQPKRRGFGSRLIERSLAPEGNGTVRLAFSPSGVVCEFETDV